MWMYILLLLAIIFAFIWFISERPTPIQIDRSHVIITGGSSGIGLSMAKLLAARGANVTIIARDKNKLVTARDVIQQVTIREDQLILEYSADVSDFGSLERAISDAIKQNNQRVDVLVASAGDTRPERFEDIEISIFDKLMKTNYIGDVNATRAVIPTMKERRQGRIIYVSSLLGLFGFPSYSGYAASKFALRGLAESLHLEFCPWNILFSVSVPPNVDTPMFHEEEKYKPIETQMIEGKSIVAKPEDVANSIIVSLSKYRFIIPYGTDGTLVSLGCGGFSPGSFVEIVPQFFLGGIFRVVSVFYLWTWKRVVRKYRK